MVFKGNSKTREMIRFLNKPPHDLVFNGDNFLRSVDNNIKIAIPQKLPRLELAGRDFQQFLNECGKIKASLKKTNKGTCGIRIKLEESPELDSYSISFKGKTVEVVGSDEMGAAQGLYYLERLLVKYNGSLPKDLNIARKTAVKRRITTTAFNPPIGFPDERIAYLDGYLSRMAHFGYNGIFITDKFFTYTLSDILPELNAPERDKVIAYLNRLTKKADLYGIGLYLIPSTILSPNAAVFLIHPELKGAKFWEGSHCLCSLSPIVLQFYREAVSNLLRDVPLLRGLILIVGGECFLHCYTRSVGEEKKTTCLRCSKENPIKLVCQQVQAVLDGAAGTDTEIIVWPYSAFYWYKGKNDYLDLIHALPKGVSVMESPSKDAPLTRQGITIPAFDCNISIIGPSERFKRIAKTVKEKSLELIVKSDSSATIEAYSIPYIPALGRWYERHSKLAQLGIDGMLGCWHINGFNGTLSDEVAYKCFWAPIQEKNECLSEIAERFFGQESVLYCLKAWKFFSDAWDNMPFSAAMTGLPYFRGPFHLGPAHPLVLDVQKEALLPDEFFHLQNVDNEFCADGEKLKNLKKTPTFMSDLSWTMPYGLEAFEKAISQTLKLWDEGLAHYKKAVLYSENSDFASIEYGVAAMFGCILRTALNLLRFQKLKIKLYEGLRGPEDVEEIINSFTTVAEEELKNAEEALRLAKADIRIGYGGYTYKWFTPEIIERKIDLTHLLIDKEIPEFAYLIYTIIYGEVR